MENKENYPYNQNRTHIHHLGISLINSPLFHMLIVIIIGVLVYANTLNSPFVFDDSQYINNEILCIQPAQLLDAASLIKGNLPEIDSFKSTILSRRFGVYTFMLNYKLHGLSVTGYHLANIFIHLMSALLVYGLIRRCWHTPFMDSCFQGSETDRERYSRWTAFFSAALFVTHPVNTQAVTYIAQRFASLATMLYLIALLSYITAALRRERVISSTLYCIAFIAAALAMLTKEISFTLPVVMFLCDRLFLQRSLRRTIVTIAPFLLTMAIIPLNLLQSIPLIPTTSGALSGSMNVMAGFDTLTRHDYFLTELRVIVTYIRLMIFPVDQNLDYDYPVYRTLFAPQVFVSLLLLLSILAVGIVLLQSSAKRFTPLTGMYRLVALGIFWFFITLSVESSIQPIENVIYEHRLYLPSVGFIMAMVCAGMLFWERFTRSSPVMARGVPAAGFLILAMMACTASARNSVWRDGITLWEDVVQKSPNKLRVRLNLGLAYLKKKRFDEAQQHLITAIQLEPLSWQAYALLARFFEQKQQIEYAIVNYKKSLAIDPTSSATQLELGNLYLKQGRLDEAQALYQTILSRNVRNFKAHYNLGLLFAQKKQYTKALQYFQYALETSPTLTSIYGDIAKAHQLQGNLHEAVKAYQLAIAGDRNNFELHFNLGLAYDNLNECEKALAEYLLAKTLRKDYVPLFNSLGVTYAKLGQYDKSLESFQQALLLDPQDENARSNIQYVNSKIRIR